MGRFSIEIDATSAYKKFLKDYLKENKFDAIVASGPPNNLIRLGYKLSKKHKIPFIADFRDLWDNDELKKDYKPGFSQRLKNRITKAYLRKWINQAGIITTVSEPLVEKIKTITSNKVVEIKNGYEEELFPYKTILPPADIFTISIIGTLYTKQDLSILLNGLKKFTDLVDITTIRLNFIGATAIESVSSDIAAILPEKCLFISDRVPRKDAIEYTLRSHVLLYAGWKTYKGIYSGKIFDYLGAHRNILLAPGDDDVLDRIIEQTHAGKIANSVDEFFVVLKNWHDEWIDLRTLAYNGNSQLIQQYTRKNQALIMASYINSLTAK